MVLIVSHYVLPTCVTSFGYSTRVDQRLGRTGQYWHCRSKFSSRWEWIAWLRFLCWERERCMIEMVVAKYPDTLLTAQQRWRKSQLCAHRQLDYTNHDGMNEEKLRALQTHERWRFIQLLSNLEVPFWRICNLLKFSLLLQLWTFVSLRI